jgi:hypothetical protein
MGSSAFNNGKQEQSCLSNAFNAGQQMPADAPKKNGKKFKISRDVG